MILIVGLGNPGEKYESTRHNIGRQIVSYWREIIGFPDFVFQTKFTSLITRGKFNEEELMLSLPEAFMNLSGKTVKLLVKYYKIKTQNVWVFHDDIDLPLGKIRIAKNRGGAGHRGIESIIEELRTTDFVRFRIGIRPPEIKKVENVESFVLQKFSFKERRIVRQITREIIEAIETALRENLEKAMEKYNK